MRFYLIFLITLCGWSHVLNVNVPAPNYEIVGGTLITEDGDYINIPGAPNLPCRKLTICLPPGAVVESVDFRGMRKEIGNLDIPALKPPLPMTDKTTCSRIIESYEKLREKFYTSDETYPEIHGVLLSKGGLRKYTVVDIACYHFAYQPLSKKLYYSPHITVEIRFRMPAPTSARAQFWSRLMDDITFDDIAQEIIYNWQDARMWYHTDTPKRANGYYIIIPASLTSSVNMLVAHRQSQGYNVTIITKEYIETNVVGDNLVTKIRNYLRDNMVDIEYVLLVGFSADIPWRSVVPFNNNPYSPWNSPDYSPIPCDLYYAELTDPDSVSWNSDGDSYYGEVYDDNFIPVGEDDPDYHADIHLGRIPYSTQSTIEEICEKIVAFDTNTDVSYKTSSLLAGAIYYYANEDNTGNARMDGADFTEELLDNAVLDRANAITLYEMGGLSPSTHTGTDSLTRTNMVNYWQNRGIMYECHHGHNYLYARKIWAYDDGDSVPEAFEMQWPTSLNISDVSQLDNDHPATTILRSCLCGNPDVYGLAAELLRHGSSAVISSSRVCWMTHADAGGIPYHFLERLVQDTTASHGIIGKSYDIARNDFMDATGFWLPAYHYNLFGDPASRQFGRPTSVEEAEQKIISPTLSVYPNPARERVVIMLRSPHEQKVELDVFDESGRFVKSLYDGNMEEAKKTVYTRLPAGVYFIRLQNKDRTEFTKLVIIN